MRHRLRTVFRPASAVLLLVALLALAGPGQLEAQERVTRTRHELGLWVGASNPVPGTATDEVLDANVGGGMFYRVNWPWVLLTELGASYSQYFSRSEQKLIVAPVYGALAYRLPIDFKVETYVKLGGGAAWLEVRPQNVSGWDPMGFAGLEFSLQASRRLRVGIRLDYHLVYEKHLDRPQNEIITLGNTDPRFQQTRDFEINNGHFFHFGLMVGFAF